MVVHGPDPWGGPWTPVHVLYTSLEERQSNTTCVQSALCILYTPIGVAFDNRIFFWLPDSHLWTRSIDHLMDLVHGPPLIFKRKSPLFRGKFTGGQGMKNTESYFFINIP